MMELVRTSETSVYYDTTWRNIPEGYNLHAKEIFRHKVDKLCEALGSLHCANDCDFLY
jgi:hypothetical protein